MHEKIFEHRLAQSEHSTVLADIILLSSSSSLQTQESAVEELA